ncbi:MAG: hypothetical protein K0U62_11500 [Actinomycetia bacterium]|nr:hypothetical protein [Actinomycetes bacterium]
MNLTPWLVAGAAYMILKSDRGARADNAFHTVTSADDLPPHAPVGAAVVGVGQDTLVFAGQGNSVATLIDERGDAYEAIVDKDGSVWVKVEETSPDEFAQSDAPYTISMGRTRTEFTAKSPTRRGRDMRDVSIQSNYPEVNDCAAAGQAVADWRWRKVDGKTRRKDQKAPITVSNAAAILASTPCEVYKKVAYEEMDPEAAIAELDSFYEESGFDTPGFDLDDEGEVILETDSTYTRRRRYDS